jgi:antitoxin component YwqK of YwqJK toxin-antitoxin module
VLISTACIGPPPLRLRRIPPGFDGTATLWWNDEQVREQGSYRAGLRNGHVRGYHSDGTPAFEGAFVAGAPDGPQRAWHANGEPALEADYARGVARGERREYDDQGVLRRRTHYVDGLVDGEDEQYHADGRTARKGRSVRGVPVGAWLEWDAEGRLVGETIWLRTGSEVGATLQTSFDPDGPPRVQSLRVLRDGAWSGRVTTWRPDGSLASSAEQRDGRHHGLERTFDESGRERSAGRREAGLRSGLWTWWDEYGQVQRTVVYEADQPVPAGGPPAAERAAG